MNDFLATYVSFGLYSKIHEEERYNNMIMFFPQDASHISKWEGEAIKNKWILIPQN